VHSKTIRTLYRLIGCLHSGRDWIPIRQELERYLNELESLSGGKE